MAFNPEADAEAERAAFDNRMDELKRQVVLCRDELLMSLGYSGTNAQAHWASELRKAIKAARQYGVYP